MKKPIVAVLIAFLSVGFDWALIGSGSDIITITVKNQFPFQVSVQVNQNLVGSLKPNGSLKVRVDPLKVPLKIDVWGLDNPRIVATKTFDGFVRNQDIIWATGDVELARTLPATSPAPPVAAEQPAPIIAAPPQKAAAAPVAAPPNALEGATTTYVKTASTLSYNGQDVQTRVKTASLLKIDRQRTSSGSVYDLSGNDAVSVGNNSPAASYGVAPFRVKRGLDEHLSSDQASLRPWLDAVNGTLDIITHKHMTSGLWRETISLPDAAFGPKEVNVTFRVNPLPPPDNRWLLITAETGLMSFGAAAPEGRDSQVYGRYKSVLVYAPAEDAFLQDAAVFTSYLGEDQLRIEQVAFAADANGEQLIPALNVTSYLNIEPTESPIAKPGELPAWGIQAAHLLDFLHLSVMTAAEGASNPEDMKSLNEILNKIIYQKYATVVKILPADQARVYMGLWNAQLLRHAGVPNWEFWLRDVVTIDLTPNFGPGPYAWETELNRPLYVSAVKMINGRLYDIKLINDFPASPPIADAHPAATADASPQAPPDNVKTPENTSSILDDLLWPLIGLGAGGAYLLLNGLGGSYDCSGLVQTVKCIGPSWANEGYTFTFPESCGCPSGSSKIGTGTYHDGSAGVLCSGCPSLSAFGSLRLTTSLKR